MDNPKLQIPPIIHALTEGSPALQHQTLDTYFTPDASFSHPLCAVPSFSHLHVPFIGDINSRWVLWMVYRWYKILSPRIVLEVDCSEFNPESALLFLRIRQIFSLFLLPFYAPTVHLTTVLTLVPAPAESEFTGLAKRKYLIQRQEDFYQSNEVVKFFWPGGTKVVSLFRWIATVVCIFGAVVLAPVTWVEQWWFERVEGRKGGRLGPGKEADGWGYAGKRLVNGEGRGLEG
ncbi:flavin-binding monooxygenase protein [Rutstroemia sp. NJR-2017a WRK4]|nr:flavin-binding monooxygenase protein [Rutstroemia sp. NJR-2017a WRK4]